MNTCEQKHPRSDKGENRIDTSTKYLIYSILSLIAGFGLAVVTLPVEVDKQIVRDTQVVYKTKYIPCPEIIPWDDTIDFACIGKCTK